MMINKGFSLVELMIIVAIIGILILMGMPMYQNYVTKVKLTELVLKHKYFLNRIEEEIITGDFDGAYSYLQSLCTKITSENVFGKRNFQCETSSDFIPEKVIMEVGLYSNFNGLNISLDGNESGGEKRRYIQSFLFLEDAEKVAPDISSLFISSEDSNKSYTFTFRKNRQSTENIESNSIFRIEDKHGNIYLAPPNQWFCASNYYDYDAQINYLVKSKRPSMCPYFTLPNSLTYIEE